MWELGAFSPTVLADQLDRSQVMDAGIRPLWPQPPRVAGPAYPVRCAPGDNLMLHAAVHRAPPGSVIVVEAGDGDFAVAGGNVCALAQQRGIAALVVDGVIRDLAEVRAAQFPVFARGVIPIAGGKQIAGRLGIPVSCGGVAVGVGDVVVADEEGIVVVPLDQVERVLATARVQQDREDGMDFDAWVGRHEELVDRLLAQSDGGSRAVDPSEDGT
jgi:regulator of RNase E activity RraA